MKKIIQNPIVDIIITFLIAYFLMYYAWFISDLLFYLIKNMGINLPAIMGEDLYNTWSVYFQFIGIWIGGFIIFACVKSYRPLFKVYSNKLKGNNIKSTLIGGLLLGLGLNLLLALVAIASGAVKLHYVGLDIGSFVLLLIAVFIQSGAEELVARVFIYQRLRMAFPKLPVIAILGNGIFFLCMHLNNPGISITSEILLMTTSVLYSLIIYYFDSFWIPIVAHTTWNFTQSIILGLPNSGIVFPISIFKLDAGTANFAYDPIFGIEGAVLSTVVSIILCVGIYCYGRKKGAKETNIWELS